MVSEPPHPSPWRTIWTRPRTTIARLGASALDGRTLLLAAAFGFRFAVMVALIFVLGDQLPLPALLPILLLAGALLGAAALQLGSYLLFWIGDLFGGDAELAEVRTALAWSFAPHLVALALLAAQLLLTGGTLFGSSAVAANSGAALGGALWALTVLGWGLTLWALVLAVVAYAEVQSFTLWLSLTSHVAVLLLELGLAALIGLLLVLSGVIGS